MSPHIKTRNLILRIAEVKDGPQIVAYFRENQHHLSDFDPKRPDDFYSEAFWKSRIPKHHEAFEKGEGLRLYIFSSSDQQEVMGSVELSQIARGPFQACYLGYGIAKKFEGKGLMYEAVGAVIEYAFGALNLHRIMANHLPENERSAKLLNRLGFVREGVAKDYLRINGEWRDHVLNSLTNAKWKEV